MWGYAAVTAAITAVVGFAFGAFIVRWGKPGYNVKESALTALCTFVALLFINELVYFKLTPVFSGAGWMGLAFINLIAMLIAYGIRDCLKWRLSGATVASVAIMLVLVIGFLGAWNAWFLGQGNVDKLKSALQVTMIKADPNDPAKAYPPTSDAHMVIVGDQAARNQAHRVMNDQGIGTRYTLGDGELQAVNGHMYYVFELIVSGVTNSKAVNYTSPGYVLVDAEDPSAAPQAKLGYKIKYWPSGTFQANLGRYVYTHGYNTVFLDDFTLEIDDSGRPYYTASINKPLVRWRDSVPTRFMTVDAQTGAIKTYDLNHVPAWVDRVYSEKTAEHLLSAWGQWGQAPYKKIHQGSNNRYKISGGLNLVYTDEGPAWQALFTSYRSDTAVQYIALMSTRSNQVRVYPAPPGLQTEASVTASFGTAPANLKKSDPTSLALHKVYGQLTWVASLVGDGQGGKTDNGRPAASSFVGVGLVNATQADASKVIIGKDKGDAFGQYATQIATGSSSADPEATAQEKTVSGKVASVSPPLVLGGNTFVIITLEGDKDHLYKGQVTETANSLAMTVAKPGDEVTITYVMTGPNNPILSIASFHDKVLSGVS